MLLPVMSLPVVLLIVLLMVPPVVLPVVVPVVLPVVLQMALPVVLPVVLPLVVLEQRPYGMPRGEQAMPLSDTSTEVGESEAEDFKPPCCLCRHVPKPSSPTDVSMTEIVGVGAPFFQK